jgi:hypothetical protein
LYHSWRKIDSTAIHDPKGTRGVIWGAGGPSPKEKEKKERRKAKKRKKREKTKKERREL